MGELTHLDESGRASMVDVGDKPATERRAMAQAIVRVSPETAAKVAAGDAPKGDVIGVARIPFSISNAHAAGRAFWIFPPQSSHASNVSAGRRRFPPANKL